MDTTHGREIMNAGQDADAAERKDWDLRLYVAAKTPRSVRALANLKKLCDEHLGGRYHIEVIDLAENPELAALHQIVAIPTLILWRYFRSRVDAYLLTLELASEQFVRHLQRLRK